MEWNLSFDPRLDWPSRIRAERNFLS